MQKPSAMQVRLLIGLGLAVLVLVYSMKSAPEAPRSGAAGAKKHKAKRAAAAAPAKLRPAAPDDATFGRYEVIASRNIFAPPAPPRPPTPAKITNVPPFNPGSTTPVSPGPAPGTKPPEPALPELTSWSYVGEITIGGKRIGIVQNDAAETTQNVALGEQFEGYKVESFDAEQIVLSGRGNRKQVLRRPTDYGLVPLGGAAAAEGTQRAPGR